MFTVQGTHPNVPISFAPITGGRDAEGSVVPASAFTQTDVVSDNESAVRIVDGANGKEAEFVDPAEDGTPEVANLTSEIQYNGVTVAVVGAQVTVTSGPPVSVEGGGLVLGDLVEDAPNPTEEPVPDPNAPVG